MWGRGLFVRGLVVAGVVCGVTLAWPEAAQSQSACPSGHVALTFDDGPGTHTAAVLNTLAARDVQATFFVVGARVQSRPSLVARAASEGHEVANHSFNHERLTDRTDAQIRDSIQRTDAAIRAAGATPLRLLRPPFGAHNARVRNAVADAGYRHITWNLNPEDWRRSSSHIRSHTLGNMRDGSVVLLHDGSSNAPELLDALPGIISGARDRGFCFGVLDSRGRVVGATAPRPAAGDGVAIVRDATWHFRNRTAGGAADTTFRYGRADDTALLCDWNGDGVATPAIVRNATWHVRTRLAGGTADTTFRYGRSDDVPVCGDWNGNGRATPGVIRGNRWHLRDRLAGGTADRSFSYGRVSGGDLPLVGDWNANGQDTPGVIRGREWHLRDRLAGGAADRTFVYGRVTDGDVPLVGDWTGNGQDTPGIVRDGRWHLRDRLSGGAADRVFRYGRSGDEPFGWPR